VAVKQDEDAPIMTTITTPTFYNPERVGELYEPNMAAAYEEGQRIFQSPAAEDSPKVLLWLIDMQVDFVFPAPVGKLTVPGAVDDTRRVAEWIYRNAQRLTHIAASLDTHVPFQIFYPSWWRNADGQPPAPYTIISAADVKQGKWQAVTEPDWSERYVETLEQVGKKELMIWPFHCMEGTVGRSLVPALAEAIMFHSAARKAQPTFLPKGTLAHTEFYSVVEPEVKLPDHPQGRLNTAFLDMVGGFDLIYIAGEARSHCVLETTSSYIRYFNDQPEQIAKLRYIDDAASCIVGFEESTAQHMQTFIERGMKLVNSADAIG
jgi:nicotinamidase/pyrazinamidase